MHSFIYAFFRRATFRLYHPINCLSFTEHYQSPKTNAGMFEFSPKFVWQLKTCNGDHVSTYGDVIRSLSTDK